MKHGWMTRGDLSQENVKRDVTIALRQSIDYLNQMFA